MGEGRATLMLPVSQTHLQLFQQLMVDDYDLAVLKRFHGACEFVNRSFAGLYRACGKPFVCHLFGVASVLIMLKAPAETVLAGLCHAYYPQGHKRWRRRGVQRARLRSIIGEEAEALTWAYREADWSPAAVERYLAEPLPGADTQAFQLLLIRLANEVDDHLDGSDGLVHPDRSWSPKQRQTLIELSRKVGDDMLIGLLEQTLSPVDARVAALPVGLRRKSSYPLASRRFFALDRVLANAKKKLLG